MRKNTFTVTGMKCVNCKARVEAAIKELPGVADAVASLGEACVTVEYDETQITPLAMKEAVEELGRFEFNA